MADGINSDDIDPQLWKSVQEQLKVMGQRFSITSDDLKKLSKGTQEYAAAQKVLSKNLKNDFSDLAQKVKEGTASAQDHNEAIKKATKAIDAMEDSEEKRELIRKRRELQNAASAKEVGEAFSDATSKLGTAAVVGIGGFLKNLQDNSSSTQAAAGILNAGIDMAQAGVTGLGKAAQAAAMPLMLLGPWGRVAGIALEALGIAAETTAPAIGKLAKFVNEYLAKELEKVFKSFNDMNASGALFTNGMTGMVNAATNSGLTIEQFSNVVKNNSLSIAASGYGMTEGAKKIGEVGKVFDNNGKQVRKHLQALGYSFEEHAELTAQVMANIGRTGNKATAERIATETEKYAESLRLISNITGEDAKAKVKQVAEQNEILAFQNELAKLGPAQAAQINAAMASLTEMDQKALRERVMYHGNVFSQEVAIHESTIAGAKRQNDAVYQLVKNGEATTQSVMAVQNRYAQQYLAGTRQMQPLAVAAAATGDSMLTEQAKAGLEGQRRAMQLMDGTYKTAVATVKGAKTPQDELTNTVIEAEAAFQDMKKTIQSELLGKDGALTQYAKVTKAVVTTLEDMLIELGVGSSGLKAKREQEQKESARRGYKLLEESGFGSNYGGDFFTKNMYEGLGGRSGSTGEKLSFGEKLNKQTLLASPTGLMMTTAELLKNKLFNTIGLGKANGGISTGPLSGYAELLHGTEAVVPLPDGNTIPVSFDNSLIVAVDRNSTLLQSILETMKDNNNLTSGILQNTY